MQASKSAVLTLEDGTTFRGNSFGYDGPTAGEVVFNTAMTGYPESLTDPSYEGQILVTTFPLLGNYGVPPADTGDIMQGHFEGTRIHCRAIITQDYAFHHSHWLASRSLADWLKPEKIPGLYNIDTRALTKHLRSHGSMLGRITVEGCGECDFYDPNAENLIALTSCRQPLVYETDEANPYVLEGTPLNPAADGRPTVVLVDCGIKHNIIRCLLRRGLRVVRVPWNYDFNTLEWDGLFISNGPGNPDFATATVANIRKAMERKKPICGICKYIQTQIRTPQPQPARAARGNGALFRQLAEPWLRSRYSDTAIRLGAAFRQYERRHERGYTPPHAAVFFCPVPSRSLQRPPRHRISFR